ncbi:MAG: hypothetical protein QG639_126 [Patescibacteria group bacterium]|nr:hypothetical protein [Patescibacteria group bacterium]
MNSAVKKIVVMGGGTGIYPVVSALKELPADISTIVTASDSGGSTGRIRDEFGFPPVGDLRQSLAALAQSEGEEWIRKILLYRFDKGTGIKGHNLGNLLLTALQDMTGSTTKALQIAEKIFRIDGEVIPVTEENVHLKITYEDGTEVMGEHTLDEDIESPKKIVSVSLEPACKLNPSAAKAIEQADLIIIGPGDYYASLMAVLVAEGIQQAMAKSTAKILYAVNLMTRLTQTFEMSALDHVKGIEKVIGKPIDFILLNSEQIPAEILAKYAAEKEYPVVDDCGSDPRVVRAPLLEDTVFQQQNNDTAHRSVLRHNQSKLKTVLQNIL